MCNLNIKELIEDINLVIEAVTNLDNEDALKLLIDIREDLSLMQLMSNDKG